MILLSKILIITYAVQPSQAMPLLSAGRLPRNTKTKIPGAAKLYRNHPALNQSLFFFVV